MEAEDAMANPRMKARRDSRASLYKLGKKIWIDIPGVLPIHMENLRFTHLHVEHRARLSPNL